MIYLYCSLLHLLLLLLLLFLYLFHLLALLILVFVLVPILIYILVFLFSTGIHRCLAIVIAIINFSCAYASQVFRLFIAGVQQRLTDGAAERTYADV